MKKTFFEKVDFKRETREKDRRLIVLSEETALALMNRKFIEEKSLPDVLGEKVIEFEYRREKLAQIIKVGCEKIILMIRTHGLDRVEGKGLASKLEFFLKVLEEDLSQWVEGFPVVGLEMLKIWTKWVSRNVPENLQREALLKGLGYVASWRRKKIGILRFGSGSEEMEEEGFPEIVWVSQLKTGGGGAWGYWFPHMELNSVVSAEAENGSSDTLMAPLWRNELEGITGDESRTVYQKIKEKLEKSGIFVPEI